MGRVSTGSDRRTGNVSTVAPPSAAVGSLARSSGSVGVSPAGWPGLVPSAALSALRASMATSSGLVDPACRVTAIPTRRSEEHTSELQSRENLVCRLLLEKKKKISEYIVYLQKLQQTEM